MPDDKARETKQSAVLEAWRGSEARFRLAADFAFDWVYWEAPDGSLIYVSPSCARITGYSAEEFIQDPELLVRLVHPADREALESHRQQERQEPGTHTLNFRLVDRAGQEHWIGHACQPVYDDSGAWLGSRGSNRDITDQVLAEQALEQAHEELEVTSEELREQNEELLATRQELELERQRYRDLFELAPDGYLVTDLDGVIQEANHAAAALLGAGEATLVGEPLDRYLFPADRPTYHAYLARLQWDQPDEPLHWEMAWNTRDGEQFHAHVSVAVGRDRLGQGESLRWLIRDITEHKQADDALRESEAKLQALFEILPVGISILDAERGVRYNNPALNYILDMNDQDLAQGLYNQRSYLYADGSPMPPDERPSARAFSEQRAVRDVEVGVVKEDGTVVWTNVSAVPLPFADWSVILVTADVTEKVQARQRIEELAVEAQRRAGELDVLFASLSDPVVVFDVAGNLVKANQAALSILGPDALGVHFAQLLTFSAHLPGGEPLEVDNVPTIRALRGETVRDYRLVVENAAGEELSILVSAAPLYTDAAVSGAVAIWHDVTRIEEAERQRDRLISILEATPDFVSTAGPDGQVLYYNRAARRILGIDAETGATAFRIGAGQPEWASRLVKEEGLPSAIREGVWRGHTALLDVTGREIPASQTILAHRGPTGEVEYLSTIAHDTSREEEMLAQVQQAQQRAEEQAALLDTMLASLAESVILYGPDTRILRTNRAAAEMFSLPPDQVRGTLADHLAWTAPVDENGEPICLDETPAMQALRGEMISGQVLGLQLGSGRRVWLSASAAPVYSPDGTLLGALVSLTDISELRRASEELEQRVRERTADLWSSNQALQSEIVVRRKVEAELRESEFRFRQLAENVDEVFCLCEPGEDRVLYTSPSFETLWARPLDQAYSGIEAVLEGVHPEDRDRVRCAWQDTGQNQDLEFRILRPDGSVRWARGRSFVVEDEGEVARRIAGIVSDVTEQREAQAAMLRADRLKTSVHLAASLAHEINNPLQSAIGCLDLALESLDSGKNPRRYFEIVCQALEQAAGVVGQLRSLHTQLGVEERIPVHLTNMLEQVVAATQAKWQSQGVGVELSLEPRLPALTLQVDAIQRVLLNMVHNALDAMPEGGVLSITAERSHEPEGVWIRFADTGAGLADEVRDHLFELTPNSKPEALGLFISQNIVQQYAGHIEVESREEGGTVFSVWLPV